jgi:hypothetical protein
MTVRLLLLLAVVALVGCPARRSMPVAVPAPALAKSPSSGATEVVDPERIEVDLKTRTVRLFQVDNGGHWLVILPGQAQQKIPGVEYRVPEDVNLDDVEFYFVNPDGRSSNAVKLAKVKKKE